MRDSAASEHTKTADPFRQLAMSMTAWALAFTLVWSLKPASLVVFLKDCSVALKVFLHAAAGTVTVTCTREFGSVFSCHCISKAPRRFADLLLDAASAAGWASVAGPSVEAEAASVAEQRV